MRELLVGLDESDGRRVGLERAVREAIRSGQLVAGTVLPSSRALAADIGMARATVVGAYEQLVIEGYLVSKHGSGTVVADVREPEVASEDQGRSRGPSINLFPGQPDGSLFPRAAWLRSYRRAVQEAPDDAFAYGDPMGERPLRRALAEYLGRARSVAAVEQSVQIFNGVVNSMVPLGEALHDEGVRRVAVEDPGFFFVRQAMMRAGLDVVGVPVDNEGLDISALEVSGATAVVVTPAHQYPLGVTMSAHRRGELVAWARDVDGWIIEDDYDGEFRYDRQPIGALQGLDPSRVVYMGTSSKMLSPGLRCSWLVAPPVLRPRLAAHMPFPGTVPTLDQLALADFLRRGEIDRHLRYLRPLYQRRQEQLLDVLSAADPWLTATGSSAGLHLTCVLDADVVAERELVARAAAANIGLFGLAMHWVGPPRFEGIVLGYSRPPQHRFGADLEAFAHLLAAVHQ